MRTKPKQDRVQKTIDHILETAERLFAEKGYEKVSTNLVAKEANMSIGSLYRYFANKTALLEHIMKKYNNLLIKNFKEEEEKQETITFDLLNKNFFNSMETLFSRHPVLMEIAFLGMETPKIKRLDKELMKTINKTQADKYQKINPQLSRKKALLAAKMVHMTVHHLLFEAKKASKIKNKFDPIIKEEIKKIALEYLKLYLKT